MVRLGAADPVQLDPGAGRQVSLNHGREIIVEPLYYRKRASAWSGLC